MFSSSLKRISLLLACGWIGAMSHANGDSSYNQTDTISPIHSEASLPFRIQIEQADFSLPNGIHSGITGEYHGKWLFLAGRTNGMHGFDPGINNFPPTEQNQVVYVVDPIAKTVVTRSLTDASSGLTQAQIDYLSVTSPQFYQKGRTLYMTGGYGVDTSTGLFSTKPILTAIDVKGLIHWVTNPSADETAAEHIRQIADPIFQVTGGDMFQIGRNPTLLVFGQNFKGYYVDGSNGEYTQEVRRFHIHDDGIHLSVKIFPSVPSEPDPNYRRRDLNVVPIVELKYGRAFPSLVALSGVFTLDTGIWTVPVEINSRGHAFMADPNASRTFKQGMSNYVSSTIGLFSRERKDMYIVLPGGISFGYFSNGQFLTDPEFPFINQVTTVKRDAHGHYKQYLMSSEFPVILSTQSNPGNQLLFGAGAFFMANTNLPTYSNGVIKFDKLGREPFLAGYIVGGIQSTLPNTNTQSDSAASPYIFRVIITPVGCGA